MKKLLFKYMFLFYIGATTYVSLEVFFRGYSHWTMFILGGASFIFLGLINKVLSWETPLVVQMLIGGLVITILEFITGYIVNIQLGWQVWNYTNITNFMNQISLFSSLGWCGLSSLGIVLDDYLRYWFFGEDKPYYRIL